MWRSFIFTLLLALAATAPLGASSAAVGTIEQPVNLGAYADCSRIPLGPVPFLSNNYYGIHRVISAPRPCTHGELEWEGGMEAHESLQAFENDPAWKVTTHKHSTKLTCQFVWDRSKGTLAKGSVPGWTIGGGKSWAWSLKRSDLKH